MKENPDTQPVDKDKSGNAEVVQTLLVVVGAIAIGVSAYVLLRPSAKSHGPDLVDGSAPVLANATSDKPLPPASNLPYVVINSDAIAAKALAAMQTACQQNPALLPHVGDVGKLVGQEVNQAAAAYLQQGKLVYMSSALLAYPPGADQTEGVLQRVITDLQMQIRQWAAEKPITSNTAPLLVPQPGSAETTSNAAQDFQP